MLQYLLDVEVGRLQVAQRIEQERDIVFPETTIIIRDIQKLMAAISGGEGEAPAAPEKTPTEPAKRRRPGAHIEE